MIRSTLVHTQAHDSVCNLKALCFMAESKVASVSQAERQLMSGHCDCRPLTSVLFLWYLHLSLLYSSLRILLIFRRHAVACLLVSTVLKETDSYREPKKVLVLLQY